MTLTYHWFLPKAIRVNARWLDALPADLRDLVRSSAKEVFADQRTASRTKTAAALADLKKLGVQVHDLDAAEKARWVAATGSLFDAFGAKSPATKEMIAKIRALR
jgi:TRAP-type transport system periplasmic protein